MTEKLTGSGDYIPVPEPEEQELGSGDFTIEFCPKTDHQYPLDKVLNDQVAKTELSPDDGEWHHVTITRVAQTTTIHKDKLIDGVLFVGYDRIDDQGLLECHYTRADKVRG